MKKVLFVAAMSLLLVSCIEQKEKLYTYVKYERDIHGGKISESETLKAISDSAAIIEAYEMLYISEGVFYDVATLTNDTSRSYENLGFDLLNEQGVDISHSSFLHRDSILNTLYAEIVLPHKSKFEELKQKFQKNKEIAESLKPYFYFKRDEFNNGIWVEPKDAPQYVDVNGIYCYFMLVDGRASNLRLKIQYRADDWLFIRSYKFSVDGQVFDYFPHKIERDHKSYIWEWSDAPVTSNNQIIIENLANAKEAKIRFIGQQYHKDKVITSKQLKSIKRTIDLYYAMGGVIN